MSDKVVIKYEHIAIGADQVPYIAGTTMKVVDLIVEHLAYGWSPAELHFQYPYLSMGQIHSALAYYWDHAEEIHAAIENRQRLIAQLRQSFPPSSFIARLKSEGLI